MSKRFRKIFGFSKRTDHPTSHSSGQRTPQPSSSDQPISDPRSGAQSTHNPHSSNQRITEPYTGGRSTPDPGPSGQPIRVPRSGGQSTPNLHSIDQSIVDSYSGGHYILGPPSVGDNRPPTAHSVGQATPYTHPGGQRITELRPIDLGVTDPYPGQLAPDLRSSVQSTPDQRTSGQPISNGIYTITNKYQHRVVYLEDANDKSPLKGHHNPENRGARWHVKYWGKEQYSLENVDHNRYANCGPRAAIRAFVEGDNREQLWYIQERPTGEYTIATIDTRNLWMLPDDEPDTPVELSNAYADPRCWWTLNSAETATTVDENPNPQPVLPDPELLLAPPCGQPIPEATIVEFTSGMTEVIGLLHPLRAACGALRVVLKRTESISHINEDRKALIKTLKVHLATVENHVAKLEEDQMIDETIPALNQDIRESLETYARELKEIYESSLVNQPKNSVLLDDVTNKIRKIDEIFEIYTTALHRFAASTFDQMRQQLARFQQESKKVQTADENTQPNRPNAYGIQHRECLRGTREKTLPVISNWVDDDNTKKWIFFFLDVAGSGKSTVAKHMAEKWKRENRLLARFFFSRDTTATMSTDSFCSTVAGAYADLDEDYKAHMVKFMARPNAELLSFQERFEGLLVGPLRAIGRRAILIIDALDECHSGQRDQMLETLRTQHLSIPLLRVFVTGRPERDITRWANDEFGFGYTNFTLLEKGDKDVELYVKHTLRDLPITQDHLYPVIRNAEGLFIWARVACELLLDCDDIEGLQEELRKEVSLDYLYKAALEQSMPKEGPSRRAMVLVLQMILAAEEPLSIAELEMLSPKRDVVEKVVTRLGSLLLYQGREDPIRLLHATFREFLTTRSKANIFFIQLELGHHTLASGCLNTISQLSKQDNTTLRNVDRISHRKMISHFGKRLTDSISRMFIYSSESWVHHCSMSYRKLALNQQILEFAYGGLKTWIGLVDEWRGVDTLGCMRKVLLLSRQNMSPQVTEMLVSQSLEAIVRA